MSAVKRFTDLTAAIHLILYRLQNISGQGTHNESDLVVLKNNVLKSTIPILWPTTRIIHALILFFMESSFLSC